MFSKVAAVTGANKGIGYAIVQELCKRGVGVVYLCSRDVKRGEDAVEKLKNEGLEAKFHQLDITDAESIKVFAEHVKKQHGGLNILINNAAVVASDFINTTYETAENVINVNYKSLLDIQEILYPVLSENARVIHISSDCGHISNLKNKYWIKRLVKEDITVPEIDEFVDWFLKSVKDGTLNEEDFSETTVLSYRISKIAVSALTRYQQRIIDRNISINCVHPGFVQTDMTNSIGVFTPEQASKTPVYLALDVDQSVKGKYFWFDKTEKEWTNPEEKLYFDYEKMVDEAKKVMQL